MKVLLTGATGAAGLPILRTLLADPSVSSVTVLARRPLPTWAALSPTSPTTHPKLTTIPDTDFLHYSPQLRSTIAAHDACIWALGKSSLGMSEAAYTEMTVGYLDAFFHAAQESGAGTPERPFRIVFISAYGADSSETSRVMYSRVKGIAENRLLANARASNGAIRATVMRPGYFFPAPADAPYQRSMWERIAAKPIGPVMSSMRPHMVISTDEIAHFAIGAAKGLWDEKGDLFINDEMKRLVRETPDAPGASQS
ncbi:hypothetical protein BV25DRAFT_1822562 [Artomyces pyxidatus]|uniref:Uncharacterized protein n=1 Tax=Artomyces pyxidatus TaxID=48021 RepID=A0ACB8T9G0_9AGAM|nr:hypothetical protein BV25DRAFT_1822562 [Artomyces pyxidatus]